MGQEISRNFHVFIQSLADSFKALLECAFSIIKVLHQAKGRCIFSL